MSLSENAPQREMPQYQCHKKVWALKIAKIDPASKELGFDGAWTITPADEGYGPVHVSAYWYKKHAPEVGGYYVVYDDGYVSYSPAKAFESGYTLIR